MKKGDIIQNIEIVDAGAKGVAVGRYENRVIFVAGAVPGDVVDVQISRKKSSFAEGWVHKYVKYSDDRVEPVCEHFGLCGGCRWQHLDYQRQLFFKEKEVKEAFVRIGKLQVEQFYPILAAPEQYRYRNKLEYTFSCKRWFVHPNDSIENPDTNALGFHIPGKFDRILDISTCHLQPEPSNAIRLWFREKALQSGAGFFDHRQNSGFFRNLYVRNTSLGEVMIILVVFDDQPELLDSLLSAFVKDFPEVSSVMYAINGKQNDTLTDIPVRLYAGKDHIMEDMDGIRFSISPKSFFQTNTTQSKAMYRKVKEFAQLTGSECVYDLYTGTGSIANFISAGAKKVVGIEYLEDAVDDAARNAALNGFTNLTFIAGDMARVFTAEFIDQHGKPDVIIADPPRAGMHADVVERIAESGAARVVYVSCNPATQARDLALLAEKYNVVEVQPLDMFPHTYHVENITLLKLKE
ncbi:MAG: 23S rRNA (uracil(1939)-C(5))-methyltransferase RlmD [Bacteroidetes bacterium]|nr:23S rRNA (uracil(1939)-C(5))-methyltransferase RlmD [Bacteroidota bacterium]